MARDTYSLALSLLDFVPNMAFFVGAVYLVRWVRLSHRRFAAMTMTGGTALVVLGGTTKATWKLLVTLGIGDFWLLGELQFMLLAPGFLAMLVSLLQVARDERKAWDTRLAAMALWKIPLLAIMTIASLSVHGILSYLAWRRKAPLASAMFVVSVVCMLSMAGMTGGEQTVARQWIEESVNSLGQIAFALGSYLLRALDRAYHISGTQVP
ncbi:MAG: hypothetical protein JXC32_17130 [Anaerolineae bacterium]|nr:hypothetical protein [Anaerolineae bacterium]